MKISRLLVTIILVVCMSLNSGYGAKFPPYLKPCHRNDPDLNKCVEKAVSILQDKQRLANGVPDLAIPPMDPLIIPHVSLVNGADFRVSFRDLKIHQADQFRLDEVNVDLPKNHVFMKITFTKLRITGDYDIEGKILILQLKGNGKADGNYTNVHADVNISLGRYSNHGKEHLKVNKVDINLDIGRPTLQFDRIFGDNEELNEQTNKVINDNIEDIIDDLKPVINEVLLQFTIGVADRITEKFSFDELFPVD